MVYLEHKFGFNRREIKRLLFERTRAKSLLKHHEERAVGLQARIAALDKEINNLEETQ